MKNKNISMNRTILTLFFSLIALSMWGNTILINEIMYRQPNPSSHVRFIELYNTTNSAINISNYSIAGDIKYTIPANSQIGPNSYFIIAANPNALNEEYSINQGISVVGGWDGTLALDQGHIQLLNPNMDIVDEVNYKGWGTWPSTDIGSGKSIQKINPILPTNAGGSWDKENPTPGTSNQSVLVQNPNNLPILKTVSHVPDRPKPNEEVTITAEIINNFQAPQLEIIFQYQLVNPGDYISRGDSLYNVEWTDITMNDDGVGADEVANDGIFSINMPANFQTNRRLVRYRIKINNRTFPDLAFDEANFSYFVYNLHALVNGNDINTLEPLQTFFFISKNANSNYTGTVVTDDEVYDHVDVSRSGYYSNPRRNYRINFNDGRPVLVKDDYGIPYKVRRDRLHFSGTDMMDKSSHGLTESIIFKMFELNNAAASFADYSHLRFIDHADPDKDYEGIHVIRDYTRNNKDLNQDFLKLRDLPDANVYGYKNPYGVLYYGEVAPYGQFNDVFNAWDDEWDDLSDGCSSCVYPIPSQEFLENNIDLDNHYGFMIAQEFIANNETNYAGQHNYYDYYNPVTQKWIVFPDDFNATFGTPRDEDGWALRSEFDPTEDVRGPFKVAILNYKPLSIEFENRLRSGLDLLLNDDQGLFLVDNEIRKIYNPNNALNWTDADQSKWNQDYNDYSEVVQDYKDFIVARNAHLSSVYSSSKTPDKPTISYTGPNNFPINQLTFTNSDFQDPQGNNTFGSLEWRVGEWSDPSNPIYDNIPRDIYEITPVWHSGEIDSFSDSFTINGGDLEVGRTYRVRVRYKDNTGRKSRWSDPIEFISGAPNQAEIFYGKVLLEGFYEAGNQQMHTNLVNQNLLPTAQPYNTLPWNYSGSETLGNIPNEVVDWILLQSQNADGTVLGQAVGLLDKDGEILNIQGIPGVNLTASYGNYISIHHRSHLAVLSANVYNGGILDFTNSLNIVQGSNQLKLNGGKYMLFSGDYDGTGVINSEDFNLWKVQGAAINQYLSIDGDGNGVVNSLDYNLWIINRSKVGVPNIRF